MQTFCFDSHAWAPNNLAAFYENVVDAINKTCYLVRRLLNSRKWRPTSSKLSKKFASMNEDMTLKLFDNNLWAPINIVAFDKNVVNAMNKKMLRTCCTHIIKQS